MCAQPIPFFDFYLVIFFSLKTPTRHIKQATAFFGFHSSPICLVSVRVFAFKAEILAIVQFATCLFIFQLFPILSFILLSSSTFFCNSSKSSMSLLYSFLLKIFILLRSLQLFCYLLYLSYGIFPSCALGW